MVYLNALEKENGGVREDDFGGGWGEIGVGARNW
jgi:hypothetical protein